MSIISRLQNGKLQSGEVRGAIKGATEANTGTSLSLPSVSRIPGKNSVGLMEPLFHSLPSFEV